jgi:hypothetical protein
LLDASSLGYRRRMTARATLVALVLLAALTCDARAEPAGVERFVDGLPSEADECEFLLDLCEGAQASLDRAVRTPGAADVLAARQAAIAEARIDDARDAASAIERKRGRRRACFDDRECRGIVPRPREAR